MVSHDRLTDLALIINLVQLEDSDFKTPQCLSAGAFNAWPLEYNKQWQ